MPFKQFINSIQAIYQCHSSNSSMPFKQFINHPSTGLWQGSIINFKISIFNFPSISISLRLKNKLLQFILISLQLPSWKLHQYTRLMCWPMKLLQMTPAHRHRKKDLLVTRFYFTIIDTYLLCYAKRMYWFCSLTSVVENWSAVPNHNNTVSCIDHC